MNERQKLNDLLGQRSALLDAAQALKDSGDQSGFSAKMNEVRDMNARIEDQKALVDELDRYTDASAPVVGTGRKDLEEMGKALQGHQSVKLDMAQLLGARRDAVTVATGTLTNPQGSGTEIRDGFAGEVSSLIDQVRTENLTGLNAYEEPYVVADLAAQGANVATAAGTARTASDPTFAKSKIAPYEVNVTSFVDRNLSRMNPADYAAKVQQMALRALRRKINGLIVGGDGQASPDMYGILNAANTAGAAIYAGVTLEGGITVDTLDELVFSYGGDEFVGGNARLLLTKANLKAIGALRGTNEKRRLYTVTPDAGSANTGVITDGGLTVPYTIVSALGDSKLVYLDPTNYLLGLFGQYTIRIDESVKAVERMNAILGDVFVGGNLVVDKGAVVGTI